ncbi:MAG: gamma-glutamylcyclotransferase [Hydrogenophaga sp.]|uniref:gamma-glutamylcyclotransferase n=1 Tax=Hydrogenophaga sp. TaxID=1904254 RepID=UPI0027213157|nr:gamma-glutamylcyclotransferase [Hydrogenophaga sp.]MDO9483544.1 gamma-glutamylcyclotransferase [Hydrogenophaga sp.]MDO9571391.1 gamma-glutamylcyclotransferase [Hydrogenophaga sp.]MDP2093362.1 gamma-glutamylcyclotransferase [Hydrogenophaga sp.]MDP3343604.1 gamma-glutamylcyclotransferase [Hydrogenophaga sp.]MDP3372855.1 gamma-glutamylcyclotransferase [Hydrogenophaga sp.]
MALSYHRADRARPTPQAPTTWDPTQRDGARMMNTALAQWRAQGPQPDLWVFAYASLVWRPEFEAAEQRLARVHGHHRCLHMWSRVNRGTPERPGLVFALVPGGSCHGLVLRVPHHQVEAVMPKLWAREMPNPVYDPKWLHCQTAQGPVQALAFTLSRRSPSYTGVLEADHYRDIFQHAVGRYGSTLDYARQTLAGLQRHGIEDPALRALLKLAD